jgi:valyl-tRNA synthetase
MTQPYPRYDVSRLDSEAEQEMEWVMAIILGIRKIRGEMDISPGKRIPVLLAGATATDLSMLEANRRYLDVVGKTESLTVLSEGEVEPESAIAMVGNLRILIPIAGLIDRQAELERLNRQLHQIESDIERIENKLGNKGFVEKAPQQVVAKERGKLEDLIVRKSGIAEQAEKISAL